MSSVIIAGDTSGTVTLQAPSAAGSTVINLPTVSGGSFVVSDSSGNVGIGTSSPFTKLDLTATDTTAYSPTAYAYEPVRITNNGAGGVSGFILQSVSTGSANTAQALISSFAESASSTATALTFGTRNSSASLLERMRIDASGNVGIGTSTPTTVGGTALCVYDSATPRIRLTSATTGNASTDGGELSLYGSDFSIENRENGNMNFYVNGGLRARIDSSGNLLVGCTGLPSSSVVGFGYDLPNRQVKSSVGSTVNTFQFVFFNPNGTVGSITTSGSTTAFNTSSDYRLKNTVAPMTGALAKVAALKPCTYKWNVDDSDGEGFIAHELAEVVPQCVTGEKDAVDAEGNPIYQGIDTSFLIATLTAAIQELNAKFEAYKEAHP